MEIKSANKKRPIAITILDNRDIIKENLIALFNFSTSPDFKYLDTKRGVPALRPSAAKIKANVKIEIPILKSPKLFGPKNLAKSA